MEDKYAAPIIGGIPSPQRQYPIKKEAYPEIKKVIQDLEKQGVMRKTTGAPTNAPIQAVKNQMDHSGWLLIIRP